MLRLQQEVRWCVALVWLLVCSCGADWAGLHCMVGAFLGDLRPISNDDRLGRQESGELDVRYASAQHPDVK